MASKKNLKELNSKIQKTPIAIIGMASLFPQSVSIDQYWDNIVNEINSITDVPLSRWRIEDYYDPDPNVPDKSYSKRGGFIPDIDFNPMDFGLPPNIIELTDASQLLGLIVAREVLEDAGYGEKSDYDRDNIGVTLGVGGGQKIVNPLISRLQYPVWKKVLLSSGISEEDTDIIVEKMKKAYIPWKENSFPGMLGNVIAGRIANRLNLGGTNCVLDAACASSLTAVKMAVSELLEYRSEIMITGGVDTDNSPFMYMCFSKTPAFTSSDMSAPFDIESDGIIIGEGVGMVALKRLENAERDNDRIYAVITGVGTSSDGRFKSIYAPRSVGQAKALRRAYKDAGIEPSTIGLIEAHGTGTAAGDVAEFSALNEVFSESSPEKQYIALGSVKSQIGHCKAAAGAAGLIKAALALHHKVLPATINIDEPHPKMDIKNTPFYLNTKTRPWIVSKEGNPRRAGVSAFGFGGTNFHFVMEEYTKKIDKSSKRGNGSWPVVITHDTPEKLIETCSDILINLESTDTDMTYYDLVNNYRINDIEPEKSRLGFVAGSIETTIDLLRSGIEALEKDPDNDSFDLKKGVYYRKKGLDIKGKVVALFSGQGSQYLDMGSDIVYHFPVMMDAHEKMDRLFHKDGWESLSSVVYPIPKFDSETEKQDQEKLRLTEFAQPAIGVLSYGLFEILKDAGFKADFLAGHSFGELTALYASGVIKEKDYFKLAKARGKAMAAPEDLDFNEGTMVAVMGDVTTVNEYIKPFPDVVIANYNSHNQVVIAGPKENIQKAESLLKENKYTVVSLPVSAAFHTKLVKHAQKPFAKAIHSVTFKKPETLVYSNSTAKPYPDDPEKIKKILGDQILNSVRFKDQIENIYDNGGRIFIEFGPKNVLTNLVQNILKGKYHMAVALNDTPKASSYSQLLKVVTRLCVTGLPLKDIDPYYNGLKKPEIKEKNAMVIQMNGSNYISEKTKQAFSDALNDGHKIKQVKPVIKETQVEVPVAVNDSSYDIPSHGTEFTDSVDIQMTSYHENHPPIQFGFKDIEQSITRFYSHQNESLKLHEQYLKNNNDYTRTFFDLMEKQYYILEKNPETQIPDSISMSMQMFHKHQNETLKVHNQYLQNQLDNSNAILDTLKNSYSYSGNSVTRHDFHMVESERNDVCLETVKEEEIYNRTGFADKQRNREIEVKEPLAVSETRGIEKISEEIDSEKIQSVVLEVISEKTGYPVEILDLEMNMEGDLGIDSIKRVEILSVITEHFPDLPEMTPDELAELKIVRQVIDKLSGVLNENSMFDSSDVFQPEIKKPEKISVVETNQKDNHPEPDQAIESPLEPALKSASAINLQKLKEVMLDVVSDKTGYPVEMLELDMDMEADLGIDSIKRVEILSAVMDEVPDLPQVSPDEIAELKTLGQIIKLFEAQIKTSGEKEQIPDTVPPVHNKKAVSKPVHGLDMKKLTGIMLEIISDKTGYPVEMLELDMDMEADLGIDSIKRVEIMSVVMDEVPDLPQINPDEIVELKTLGEIIQIFSSNSGISVEEKVTSLVQETGIEDHSDGTIVSNFDVKGFTDTILEIVRDKTGYPKEMIQLDMDIEADLGIDSIKRVEIMSAVMDEYPNLPQVNPDAIAEVKTLNEIIIIFTSNNEAVSPEPVLVKKEDSPIPAGEKKIDPEMVTATMLEIVSDKTGYPKEMLRLDMDMEADLGIDSIKRVEIISAVIEEIPELPNIQLDDIAEYRTLGEIIEAISKHDFSDTVGTTEENKKAEDLLTLEDSHGAKRSIAKLVSLQRPDYLDFCFPKDRVCLITDDGTKVTLNLVKALTRKNWKTVVLKFPESLISSKLSLPQNISHVTLGDLKEETLKHTLQKISDQYGSVGGFIHLDPHLNEKDSKKFKFVKTSKQILLQIFLMAKYLKSSLNIINGSERNFFVTVARLDGKLGLGREDYSVISGGLFGLTKTLKQEWKNVFTRAVDISPKLGIDKTVDAIISEIHDPNVGISETSWDKNSRYTLVPEVSPVTPSSKKDLIDSSFVFLVSGGARGVTSQCVIKLAQDYQSKFILIGRSGYTDNSEPKWAKGIYEEADLKKAIMNYIISQKKKPTPQKVNGLYRPLIAAREIKNTLDAIKKAGGEVAYISADVTDSKKMKKHLKPVIKKMGDITGVIHGAGVLADKFIEDKTIEDFESVFMTKIDGLEAILNCVDGNKLTHLSLFSSAAGFFGNEGQSDYAVANDILNKIAYSFKNKYPKCHVNSFNWGPWDGGLVTPELKKYFTERNIQVIPIDAGAKLFSEELSSERNFIQVLVGSSMQTRKEIDPELRTYRVKRKLLLADNPFLTDHKIGGNPVMPTVCAISWMSDICEQLYPGYSFSVSENYKLYKGIVFDNSQPEEYTLHIKEVDKSHKDKIVFDTKITSERTKGLPVNNYSTRITLNADKMKPPLYLDTDYSESHIILGETIYNDSTLFHGPNFHSVIKIININPEKVTMLCEVPDVPVERQGQFKIKDFNPFAADAQFQGMVLWVRAFHEAVGLPSSAGKLEHFERIPENENYYVSMDIKSVSNAKFLADITLHNKEGKIFTRTFDAEIIMSKHLNRFFGNLDY